MCRMSPVEKPSKLPRTLLMRKYDLILFESAEHIYTSAAEVAI